MTELIQKAIDKIDSEADKIGGTHAQIIVSHIIDHNLKSDKNAQCILDEEKSLKACLNSVKSKAKKEAHNNVAVISDDTVYSWVDEYYGFSSDDAPTENKIIDLFDLV